MKKIYVSKNVVVAIGWIAAGVQATIAPMGEDVTAVDVEVSSPVEVGWLLVESENGREFKAPPPLPPTIGPNEFHFLWTMAEQVAIEELRESDTGIKLFLRRLDDPRTTEVALADPTVQGAVRHTVEQLAAMGVVDKGNIESRVAVILAGPAR